MRLSGKNLFIPLLAWAAVLSPFPAEAERSWDEREAESEAQEEMFLDEETAAEEMGGSMTGTVIGVNVPDRKLTVRDSHFGGRVHTFRVQSSATFFGAGNLSDIHAGDEISIDYFSMMGQNTAQNIVMEKRAKIDTPAGSSVEKALVSR